MFIGILIISVFVLSLILWFWMQGRIQETGILLSLGFSKGNILAQYLSEVAIVFSFALMLSLPMSHQISEKLAQTVVKQAQAKTEAAQNQELGGLSMGSDANSSVASQTLEHLDVHIQKEDFIKVIAMGHVIILLSVGSASGYLLRMKPKEILSKMS